MRGPVRTEGPRPTPQDDQFHRIPPPLATGQAYYVMVPRGRALGPTGGFQIVTAGTSHSKAQRAAGTSRDATPPLTLAGQPLLVLTHDPAFFATFKRVADPAHELRAVRSETDLASALMALHAGVVVLDTTSLTTPTGEVARQLEAQFPDVVLIVAGGVEEQADRKSTRLNSSHQIISYAVFCLKKKKQVERTC